MNIYFFDTTESPSLDVVGGKGMSLIKMTKLDLNVPYGFIISTHVWKEFKKKSELSPDIKEEIFQALKQVEERIGYKYGDTTNPLIVSVRSGAKFSMPGMMETILDVGITPSTFKALVKRLGLHATLSSYQQFLRMFGHTVLKIDHKLFEEIEKGISETLTEEEKLQKLVDLFTDVIKKNRTVNLDDAHEVLSLCVEAVLNSFDNPGAVEYRNVAGIPHDVGTAVIIQQMVFGNLSNKSGSAVVFSRDFETGKKILTGHYLECSQGENVVRGYSSPKTVDQMPQALKERLEIDMEKIENDFKDIVDVEFTWEDFEDTNRIFVLQSRVAKVPSSNYLVIQSELVKDGIKNEEQVLSSINADTVYSAFSNKLVLNDSNKYLCSGSPLHTGVGVGEVALSVKDAKDRLKNGESVVLVCTHFDPNDLELLTGENKLQALVTTEGGPSSHMGLVLNVLNIPGVMGIVGSEILTEKKELKIGDVIIKDKEAITVDSQEGKIYRGKGNIVAKTVNDFVKRLCEKWEAKYGFQNAWADFADESKMEIVQKQFEQNLHNSKNYLSKKAQQTYVVNTCFDPNISIYTDIIETEKTNEIIEVIQKLRQEGKGVWLRSAYDPDLLQSPYAGNDMTEATDEQLKSWFNDSKAEDIFSKFGNYNTWKSQEVEGQKYSMVYALVPHDEKGKLDKSLMDQHFACSLRCERGKPTKIIIDIFDGSPHTRVLGQKSQNEIMSIVIVANKTIPSKIGSYHFKFGLNMFKPEILNKYQDQKDLMLKMEKIGHSCRSSEDFVNGINKLIENSQIKSFELSKLIDERKLGIIKYVSEKLLGEWWKSYGLSTRMWALNKLTGANVLEVQGRYSDDNKWMLIYGTKGEEERSIMSKK